MFNESTEGGYNVFMEVIRSASTDNPEELIQNPGAKHSVWEKNTAAAER